VLDGCTDEDCTTQVYHVTVGPPSTERELFLAVIDGFIIQNGAATGSSHPHNSGGGLLSQGRPNSLVVRNSWFRENTAGNYGGAILAEENILLVVNTVFTSNSAENGGAVASIRHGAPILINCSL